MIELDYEVAFEQVRLRRRRTADDLADLHAAGTEHLALVGREIAKVGAERQMQAHVIGGDHGEVVPRRIDQYFVCTDFASFAHGLLARTRSVGFGKMSHANLYVTLPAQQVFVALLQATVTRFRLRRRGL